MHWTVAVRLAQNCNDVTYDEWGRLFVSKFRPEQYQIDLACETAHKILVRNGLIVPSVKFALTGSWE